MNLSDLAPEPTCLPTNKLPGKIENKSLREQNTGYMSFEKKKRECWEESTDSGKVPSLGP